LARPLPRWKTLQKTSEEKLGKLKSLRTFALPNRKRLLSKALGAYIERRIFILIENKIWRLKKSAYLCTPNHKQGLQTARQGLEKQSTRLH
jgi:hypothetical protein